MMSRRVGAVTLLFALGAWAHGGAPHVMGTVKAITQTTLTVQTNDNKEVAVRLEPETKFEKSGAPATVKDLSVGERVVVHTKHGAEPLTAALVRFGKSGTPKTP